MQQKCCGMSQYFTGNQTENASFAVSKCFTVMVLCSLRHDMKIMWLDKINLSHDKNV